MPASQWEHVPAHDAWVKKITFEAVPGHRRRNTYEVAVRRERKGSKIWRADLLSMMGWEALTPTHYERVEDAKREIDHILAAFSRVRHDPHNDDDIQAVAHYVVKHSGSDRDPGPGLKLSGGELMKLRGLFSGSIYARLDQPWKEPAPNGTADHVMNKLVVKGLAAPENPTSDKYQKFLITSRGREVFEAHENAAWGRILKSEAWKKKVEGRDPRKRLTKPEKVALVMSLAQGDEVIIDGRIWFRIDANEFKVHRKGFEPDTKGSDTTWIPRRKTDVAGMV